MVTRKDLAPWQPRELDKQPSSQERCGELSEEQVTGPKPRFETLTCFFVLFIRWLVM